MKNPIRRKLDEMPFDRLITWVCSDGIEREIWIHATGYEFWNGAYWETEYRFPDGSVG